MAFTLKPAVDKEFFDRKELIEEMLTTLINVDLKMGFALIGPRRIGKTSIYMELVRLLKMQKKIVPVYFSVWELLENSIGEFVYVLTHKIINSYKGVLGIKYKIKNAISLPVATIISILKTTDIKIKILDEIEFALSARYAKKEFDVDLVTKAFSLPEELAKKTQTRCVLIIDEFPSIAELKNGKSLGINIIKLIRTINESYKYTILNISGSIKKTMETAVLMPSSPFYRQFIVKNIMPFEKKDIKLLLTTNLHLDINPNVLDYIYSEIKGIPFYIQILGRKLAQKRVKHINLEIIKDSIDEFIQEEGNLIFTEEFSRIGTKERHVLIVMSGHNECSISQIAKETQESINAVSRYLLYLMQKGIVSKKQKGIYLVDDPMFQKWIMAQRYID